MENGAAQQSQSPAASPVMSRRTREANPFRAMVFGEQADKMIAQGTSVIKLSLGESDFSTPPAVRGAMREQYDGRALPYATAMGPPELRQAIANFYRERHDPDIDPKHIYATVGGSAALSLVTTLIVDPGDDVIVADPSYPCNRGLTRSSEGRIIDAPTSVTAHFHLTADLCGQYWTSKTKAVMVTSPSNPTDTIIDFNVLDEMCKLAASCGAWRTVDEAYLDLVDREPDGTEAKSVLACDLSAIVCNSFSKPFGVTGRRLGWVTLLDGPTVPRAADDLATNYYLCAHTPTQHATLACSTPESLAECEARHQELPVRHRIVIDGPKHVDLLVEVESNGAFYAYFNIFRIGLDVWTLCECALDEAHVVLTPGRDFGTITADTHVHLSYAAPCEVLTEGLERLGTFVESL